MRMAVTSQRRVNLYGSVLMSTTGFPVPILGIRKIWKIQSKMVLFIFENKSKCSNWKMNLIKSSRCWLFVPRKDTALWSRACDDAPEKTRKHLCFHHIQKTYNWINLRISTGESLIYYISLSIHGFVQSLPLNQEQRDFLFHFHVQPFVEFLYIEIKGLTLVGIHNGRVQALHTKLATIIQGKKFRVPGLHSTTVDTNPNLYKK